MKAAMFAYTFVKASRLNVRCKQTCLTRKKLSDTEVVSTALKQTHLTQRMFQVKLKCNSIFANWAVRP